MIKRTNQTNKITPNKKSFPITLQSHQFSIISTNNQTKKIKQKQNPLSTHLPPLNQPTSPIIYPTISKIKAIFSNNLLIGSNISVQVEQLISQSTNYQYFSNNYIYFPVPIKTTLKHIHQPISITPKKCHDYRASSFYNTKFIYLYIKNI